MTGQFRHQHREWLLNPALGAGTVAQMIRERKALLRRSRRAETTAAIFLVLIFVAVITGAVLGQNAGEGLGWSVALIGGGTAFAVTVVSAVVHSIADELVDKLDQKWVADGDAVDLHPLDTFAVADEVPTENVWAAAVLARDALTHAGRLRWAIEARVDGRLVPAAYPTHDQVQDADVEMRQRAAELLDPGAHRVDAWLREYAA
jgi:hypothetical protein